MGGIMKLVPTFCENHTNFIDYETRTAYRRVHIYDSQTNELNNWCWEKLEDDCVWVQVSNEDELNELSSFIKGSS